MSTNALLASLAILYSIAQADPAVLTMTGADPIGAVTTPAVAAGLSSISAVLSEVGNGVMARPVTARGVPRIAGGTPVMTAEPSAAGTQPFHNGSGNINPDINGTGTFAPGAADTTGQPLFTGLSFSFGAELYAQQADPAAAVPETSTRPTIIGFVGLGFMPYLVARAMLAQPDRFAFTVRTK